jgi:hypothetical protein
MDIIQKTPQQNARDQVGIALYGDAYTEAQATASPTDFLMREYDKRISSVLSAVKGLIDPVPYPVNPYRPTGPSEAAFSEGARAREFTLREALGIL